MSDAELLYALERHFPFGWIVAGLIGAGNVTATLLTLLAQAFKKLRPCRSDRAACPHRAILGRARRSLGRTRAATASTLWLRWWAADV